MKFKYIHKNILLLVYLPARVNTKAGYALLNIFPRYKVTNKLAVFSNITNALNQHYSNVGFNMNLNKQGTELFYGQRQDPIKAMLGVKFTFLKNLINIQ